MDKPLIGTNGLRAQYNEDGTKLFFTLYLGQDTRLLIPVSLENATVEKYNSKTSDYVEDNLSTVEYHAKRKGLI